MSELFKACLLGIVEGLTEFIPVSSTGHLILFGEAVEFKGGAGGTFEVFIQLGAILAVVVLYHNRFRGLMHLGSLNALRGGTGFSGWVGLMKLGIACVPAFILGFLVRDLIKAHLFGSVTVALALIVGGLIMVGIERFPTRVRTDDVGDLSYLQAFLIGVVQCFALWPGMSRSGATIVGGMLLGLSRSVAAEFSFLVAVPVMCAAVGYDLLKSWDLLEAQHFGIFTVGFIVSFVVAVLAIKFFMAVLNRVSLAPFGYYRIVLGAIVLILIN